jgi:outer membrane beta-barrel protein
VLQRLRLNILFAALLGTLAVPAQAAGPSYRLDPFEDKDFTKVPMLLGEAHPLRGKTEIGMMFSGSVTDKYSSHMGGVVDINHYLWGTLAIGGSIGYLHGALNSLVTSSGGVIGRKVVNCTECGSDVSPDLPDAKQITGTADAYLMWAPLYGKINVVSEAAISIQIYTLLGGGVNGTRVVTATRNGDSNYTLNGGGALDGGMFDNAKAHLTAGAGLKIFLTERIALRGEFRYMGFRDTFSFKGDNTESTIFSSYYFGQGGLAMLF